jgi:hypothetical protein
MEDEPEVIQWKIRTLTNAYEERPPTEYVVDKYFSLGSLNIVYGAPASMKSMLLADMCAAVVAGADWLPGSSGNGAGIPVKQTTILWVDMDNGTRRTDERMEAVAQARKLPDDAPFYYVSMPMPPLNVTDFNSLIYLKTIIRDMGAELVVIDNLGLITGEIEENSAAMAMVMGYLRQIAEGTNCALIVVHHQRKGGAGGSRLGDALRGHSSIEAAIDLAIHVAREQNSNEVTLQSTKTRGVDVPMVTARFNYGHRDGTNDLQIAWFDGKPVIRGENPVRDAIMHFVNEHGEITKTRLVQAVYDDLKGQESRSTIRSWVDDLANVGKELEMDRGEYNALVIRKARPGGANGSLPL